MFIINKRLKIFKLIIIFLIVFSKTNLFSVIKRDLEYNFLNGIVRDYSTEDGKRINQGNLDQAGRIQQGAKSVTILPTPLFTEGLNFVPKNMFVINGNLVYADLERDGNREHDYLPYVRFYYGIAKRLTFILTLPFADIKAFTKNPDIIARYKGILNSLARFSYPIYARIKDGKSFIATILFGMELPTLNVKQDIKFTNGEVVPLNAFPRNTVLAPALGIILRGFASYISDWYAYVSIGGIKKIKYKNIKQGDLFTCNFGFGPIIKKTDISTFTIMAEFNFYHVKRNKLNGLIDPATGREAVFGGLSLCYSYKNLLFQVGAQFPIFENLLGNQKFDTKAYYATSISAVF